MSKSMKLLLGAALSFLFCFLMIGYAALTDTLIVKGDASVSVPEGLYITGMTLESESNMDTESFVSYSTTVEALGNRTNAYRPNQRRAGTVTYLITVMNNTKHEYAYRGLYYQTSVSGYNGNGSIATKAADNKISIVSSLDSASAQERIVAPNGGTLTFRVTYTYGKSLSDVDYKTLVNYQFGINVETEVEAREAIFEKFLNILNTTSTYDELIERLDDKYDGYNEWTSNYIGNVGGATTDDSVAVNTLFAGQLQMIINGQTRAARVIIKHENLDNNTMTGDDYVAYSSSGGSPFRGYGCEMTLYFTVDPLTTANGQAPVYVSVYTCDRNEAGEIVGSWYPLGETYYGQAPIVGYKGESGGTGSFVTDKWVAYRATYSPSSSYSYTVAAGTSIKTLMQVVDDNTTAELQSLLNRAKAMIDDTTYAGTGIRIIEDAYDKNARYFTVDENGNPTVIPGQLRATLLPAIAELDYALIEAQKAIDEILGRN